MASRIGAILAAVCCACLAQPGFAQIRVMAPETLVKAFESASGRIDGSTATFGAPFYGERILGRLVWGDPKNQSHCTEDDYTVPKPEDIVVGDKRQRLIHIIMVRRGLCSFVKKAAVAQVKGAHAVVIVDAAKSNATARDIQRIIVADDGSGQKIEIPSILISAQEGARLIAEAKKPNSQVIIELAWDVPTNHVVTMDLWMSAGSLESMRFLKDFTPNRKVLNDAVRFRPHYHIFGMQSTGNDNQQHIDLCTNNSAFYCAEAPGSTHGRSIATGRDVIEEDVRQLCIHEIYHVARESNPQYHNQPTVYSAQYWDYVSRIMDECPTDVPEGAKIEHRFGRICSEALMTKVGIDPKEVQKCHEKTKEEKLRQQRSDTAWSPRALRINGWRYSGDLEADTVTRAICAGFINQPHACTQLIRPMDVFEPRLGKPPEEGVGWSTFSLSVLLVLAVTCGALFLYKRSLTRHIHSALREEVMLEVQAQMDTYKQLPS